ncbi:MAG: protein-S-isoprenylcysteine O-methyltransferase Ste14 [Flavobacteriales bacterium]|jgi:protein-S-isoprenylcysteine O-methyltransferase Ste14
MAQLKNQGSKIVGALNISNLNQYVRHPLYFAALFIFWGLLLAVPSTGILAITLVSTAYLIIGTKLEEGKLIQEFEEAYRLYQKDVPMLIPRIIKR